MRRRITVPQARRIAVATQGLAAARPKRAGRAALRRTISRLGILQLDSVNVFERSHYLPLLARLGPYDRAALDGLVHHDRPSRPRLGEYTEYGAHEAAILPVSDWPLWEWHRRRPPNAHRLEWLHQHRTLMNEVLAEFSVRGPMTVSDLDHEANVSTGGGWWNKNDAHWISRHLARQGALVTVGRRRFQPVFAVAQAVLPPAAHADIPKPDAIRELIRRAAIAYGIATLDDLADYYRLPLADARRAVAELEAAEALEPVQVEGWGRPAWLAEGTRVPRSVETAALLSPFDPLVWYRPRAKRLFGFYYRISIYTPAAQRTHGYYVLPVLIDEDIVGRIDLKSDRKAGVLRVQHANIEPAFSAQAYPLAGRVVPLLEEAAAWQGLTRISVAGNGDWAQDIAAQCQ